MKFGVRKPNLKKSLKARTTGKLKRKVKSTINPFYGKKGVGWIKNPKKAAYNKVYNKVTIDPLKSVKKSVKKNTNNKAKISLGIAIIGLLTIFYLPGFYKITSIICAAVFFLLSREYKKDEIVIANKQEDTLINKPLQPINTPVQTKDNPPTATFDTYVAGVMHKNDKGISIQELFKEYVENNYDCDNFEEWTNKEILEEDEDIYQYDLDEIDTVTLEFEPTNPYDPNAIKIIHEDMGHIGYIPSKYTAKVKKILQSNNEIVYELSFKGGKHKYCDIDEYGTEKLITETEPYYANLYISY